MLNLIPLLYIAQLTGIGPPTVDAIELAPAMAQNTKPSQPVGVFFTKTLQVDIPAGSNVWLAANQGCDQQLSTDDVVTLTVARLDGTQRQWSHDFRDAGQIRILPISPVDVTDMFGSGTHTVTLVLRDLMAPYHATNAYWLVIKRNPVSRPNLDDNARAADRDPIAATPTATQLATTAAPNADAVEPEGHPSQLTAEAVAQPSAQSPDSPAFPVLLITAVAVLAVTGLAAAVAVRRASRNGTKLLGWITVVGADSKVLLQNASLHGYGKAAVLVFGTTPALASVTHGKTRVDLPRYELHPTPTGIKILGPGGNELKDLASGGHCEVPDAKARILYARSQGDLFRSKS